MNFKHEELIIQIYSFPFVSASKFPVHTYRYVFKFILHSMGGHIKEEEEEESNNAPAGERL